MKNIKLPGPESRIVVFGNTVFKLKYKLSSMNNKEVHQNFSGKLQMVQEDIKELTATILERLQRSDTLAPLRTDLVVVFPEVLPWDRVGKLGFSYEGRMLTAYPDIIFMLVHVLASPPTTPKRRTVLGKHKLRVCPSDSSHEKEEETDQNITSSQKKLKIHPDEAGIHKGESSVPDQADIPMETAQHYSTTPENSSSPEQSRCSDISSSSGPHHHQYLARRPPSLYQRLVRVVKYILGW